MGYNDIIRQLQETYNNKNADYGDSFGKTIEKYGLVAAMIRISDKFNRLEALMKNERKVKDETLKDTLLDMANYCIMTAMEVEGEEDLTARLKEDEIIINDLTTDFYAQLNELKKKEKEIEKLQEALKEKIDYIEVLEKNF